jgi:hypothetical protein
MDGHLLGVGKSRRNSWRNGPVYPVTGGYTTAIDHILKDVEALADTKRKREGKAPLLRASLSELEVQTDQGPATRALAGCVILPGRRSRDNRHGFRRRGHRGRSSGARGSGAAWFWFWGYRAGWSFPPGRRVPPPPRKNQRSLVVTILL